MSPPSRSGYRPEADGDFSKMTNEKSNMENGKSRRSALRSSFRNDWTTEFSIYHLSFEIFHLVGTTEPSLTVGLPPRGEQSADALWRRVAEQFSLLGGKRLARSGDA